MAQQILVPVDASDPSGKAVEYACRHFADASITALHVIHPPDVLMGHAQGAGQAFANPVERGRKDASELLENASNEARELGVTIETAVRSGNIEPNILTYIEEHEIDLVIIGSHGRSGLARVALGSVAEKVVRRSPVPVLVVR